MAAFKCEMCGGKLIVNDDHTTCTCDHCGRTIGITDEMREYANKLEREQQEKEYEEKIEKQKQQEKDDENLKFFKKRKLSKILIVFVVICLLICINSFKSQLYLRGFISLVQTAVFAIAWLMGMQIIKEKKSGIHIALAILGFVLIIPFGMTSGYHHTQKTESPSISDTSSTDEEAGIYTYSVRNYVGKNLAAFGEEYGDYRVDEYGSGQLRLIFVADDGSFVNFNDKETLKEYVVTAQNIAANSNLTVVHLRDSSGEPYSNLVDYQSYEEIVLYVNKVGEDAQEKTCTTIKPSPDRRTYYVRDYVGRNLASFGSEYGDDRIDEYGAGKLKLVFTAQDGSYVDPSSLDSLREYVVVSQDLEPNTELDLEFETNSYGEEYDNLIRSQSYDDISLTVAKVSDAVLANYTETSETEKADDETKSDTADEATYSDDSDFKYESNGIFGGVEITGYTGDATDVEIPSELDDKKVTAIGDGAFENCTSMKSITIWADIEEFGDECFKGCTELTEIDIPNETTKIGKSAFEGCTKLSDVIIWGDVTEFGDSCFKDCSSIKEIDIPNECKTIGNSAFENCTGLTSVIFWGCETIGDKAFKNCTGITEIDFPNECESIGDSSFEGCTALTDVIVWNDDMTIGKNAFKDCTNLKDVPK